MGLFQRAPRSKEEASRYLPLELGPDDVIHFDEKTWYSRVYRGEDAPQLTVRAVLMGSILGFLLAFTNLYIGLKTGWALGVAITACILSYSIWQGLLAARIAKSPMTILETNCMQSTASSAGYATGGTMVSAISALLMLSVTAEAPGGQHLDWKVLSLWTFFLGILGTVLAIPMKRSLINRDRLKFPSGTAAAVTLQSLYSQGGDAVAKARALMGAALAGAVFPILIELNLRTEEVKNAVTGAIEKVRSPLLPAHSSLFDWLPTPGSWLDSPALAKFKPSDWTMAFDHNPVMIAAGVLVGLRTSIWMMVGSLTLIFAVGPIAFETPWLSPVTDATVGAVTSPGRAWKEIGIWLGVPIMVASGLLSFAFQWRTIVRAFSGLAGGSSVGEDPRVQSTEVPISWFMWGGAFSGAFVVWIGHAYFHIPWSYGVLAVILTFFLSLVAARATGESDITPIGAMGKIMQLTYGVLIPQSTTANLMTASITSSAAGSAADLLNDLKSGYLLGANPRRQFMAQMLGVISGTAATVLGFFILVPDATALTGADGVAPKFPAPAAQAWKAVAEVFKHGLDNMHPMHQEAISWGLGIGAVLVIAETFLPKVKEWVPSATGIGLGLILPFQYPFAMLLGAVIAALWSRSAPQNSKKFMVPVAAGAIAGISIAGVLVAVINNVFLG